MKDEAFVSLNKSGHYSINPKADKERKVVGTRIQKTMLKLAADIKKMDNLVVDLQELDASLLNLSKKGIPNG